MIECKHDGNWRLQGAGGLNMDVVCEKCGARIREVLDSQEQQLEAAADDWADYVTCENCPYDGKCDDGECCYINMRKRWKEASEKEKV